MDLLEILPEMFLLLALLNNRFNFIKCKWLLLQRNRNFQDVSVMTNKKVEKRVKKIPESLEFFAHLLIISQASSFNGSRSNNSAHLKFSNAFSSDDSSNKHSSQIFFK